MFRLLTYLKDFIKSHRWHYFSFWVASIIDTFVAIYLPELLGQFVDAIVDGTMTWSYFIQNSLIGFALVFVGYGALAYFDFGLYLVSYRFRHQLYNKYMNTLLKRRVPFYDEFNTGDLLTRGTQDVHTVSMATSWGFEALIDGTFYLLCLLGMMFFNIHWQLTLVSVIPLLPITWIFKKYGSKVEDAYDEAQKKFSQVNDEVLEMIDGIRVMRAYAKEDDFSERFSSETQELFDRNNVVAGVNAVFQPTISFCQSLSLIIALSYGSYLISQGVITVGELVSFQVYLNYILWPLIAISDLVITLQQGTASYERYDEVMQTQDGVQLDGDLPATEMKDINFNHYSYRYENDLPLVLEDIQLLIKSGQTIGIAGKTGSGKSTLIRQLLNQLKSGLGELKMGEQSYWAYQDQAIRRLIGYVPQDHILFSRTIYENIQMGKNDATDEEIKEAVRLADFDKDVKRFDAGLHTLVGEKGVSLSGGQKQRLAIARALVRQPDLLILDDSLSAVDAATEAQIIQNLHESRQGRTNIIVSHRLSALKDADYIIVLDQGKIIESGKHDDLLKKDGWYSHQWRHQEGMNKLQIVEDGDFSADI